MAVTASPTSCEKTAWVLKLVQNASYMIDLPPSRIHYCYGEYQCFFHDYSSVIFREGLPEMTDDVFDGRQLTLLIIDDLMSETNQLIAEIFTKILHHRNISVIYMTQNVFEKKIRPNHQSQLTLSRLIQKSSRCQSVCRAFATDVP